MNETESQWDKLLKIKTTGRDDSHADQYRYPYEPTPYSVLERLANSGLIGKGNSLLDYGTGKGRVCFYLSYPRLPLKPQGPGHQRPAPGDLRGVFGVCRGVKVFPPFVTRTQKNPGIWGIIKAQKGEYP